MGTYLILSDRYAEEMRNDDRFSAYDALNDVCLLFQRETMYSYLTLILVGDTSGITWL